jgi:hypothetical protein
VVFQWTHIYIYNDKNKSVKIDLFERIEFASERKRLTANGSVPFKQMFMTHTEIIFKCYVLSVSIKFIQVPYPKPKPNANDNAQATNAVPILINSSSSSSSSSSKIWL